MTYGNISVKMVSEDLEIDYTIKCLELNEVHTKSMLAGTDIKIFRIILIMQCQ